MCCTNTFARFVVTSSAKGRTPETSIESFVATTACGSTYSRCVVVFDIITTDSRSSSTDSLSRCCSTDGGCDIVIASSSANSRGSSTNSLVTNGFGKRRSTNSRCDISLPTPASYGQLSDSLSTADAFGSSDVDVGTANSPGTANVVISAANVVVSTTDVIVSSTDVVIGTAYIVVSTANVIIGTTNACRSTDSSRVTTNARFTFYKQVLCITYVPSLIARIAR